MTHGVLHSRLSETSYFQSKMHFDDSVESIADSDLEDGESQKMLTSPLYAQKASGKPGSMLVQERGKCTIHSNQSKGKFEVAVIEGQTALAKPNALFSSEQGNLIRSSVYRNAIPSNLRGSLLEGKHGSLAQSGKIRPGEASMSSPSTSASVNYNDKRKSKDWRSRAPNSDLLKLDENQFDYRKKFL